ncbi:MAG: hypothetical protein ACUVUG_05550 [Candidatus Aminicenantia bacterium]
MIFLRVYYFLIFLIGLSMLFKNKLYEKRWFLKTLLFSIPLPFSVDISFLFFNCIYILRKIIKRDMDPIEDNY